MSHFDLDKAFAEIDDLPADSPRFRELYEAWVKQSMKKYKTPGQHFDELVGKLIKVKSTTHQQLIECWREAMIKNKIMTLEVATYLSTAAQLMMK